MRQIEALRHAREPVPASEHHEHGGDACDWDACRDVCRECGVVACPCDVCGGLGYHRDGCADTDGCADIDG
jgi:hypothetical protein